MSFLFGSKQQAQGYQAPKLEPLPAAKSPEDMQAEADTTAKAAELERRKRAKGQKSTILTSPQGDLGTPTLLTKTALGE